MSQILQAVTALRDFWKGVRGSCGRERGIGSSLGFMGGKVSWKQKEWPRQVTGSAITRWQRRLFSCGCSSGTICRSETGGLGDRVKGNADLEDLVSRLCGCISIKVGTKGPISQTIPTKTGWVACLLDPRNCGGQTNPTGYSCCLRGQQLILLCCWMAWTF